MREAPAPLYLDEDVSVVVAAILRARGFDGVTSRDAGRLGRSDSEQLAFAAEAGRVILTHNRVDFERLHREWLEAGRPHAGILIARRRLPQEIAGRVGRLLSRLTGSELRSRIYGRNVEGAVHQTARLAPQLRGTPVMVLFGFVIHPSAREAASRLGAIVISSSGRA